VPRRSSREPVARTDATAWRRSPATLEITMRKVPYLYVLLFAICPALSHAQKGPAYKDVTLDAIYAEWNETTKSYSPGMSVMQPQKLKFTAKYASPPQPCNNSALESIFNTLGKPGILKQVAITHCIKFTSEEGKTVNAWVQDVLVPGLQADAKLDGLIEIYADLLAYGVGTDRTRNMPFMLINRFEPK
jgi:hypothetical protein